MGGELKDDKLSPLTICTAYEKVDWVSSRFVSSRSFNSLPHTLRMPAGLPIRLENEPNEKEADTKTVKVVMMNNGVPIIKEYLKTKGFMLR